jgi:hypothetical protein
MGQHCGHAAVGHYFRRFFGNAQEKENRGKMNRKQLLTLVVLGLVIGGLGLFLYNRKASSWRDTDQAMGQEVLKGFPLNDVTRVRILQPDAELNLAKVDDQWTVKERWNYPANFSEITDLLRKLWELKSVQTLKVGPSQHGRLQLLSPEKEKGTNAATLAEFYDKSGKPVHSLLLGKKATRQSENASPMGGGGDYPVGRYVAVPSNPETVWLVSETLTDVEAKPDRWLSKDFFKVEKIRSIAVTHPEGTNSWKLVREKEGGDLELADKAPGEEFDKNKAYSAGNALSYPSFNDVVNPEAKPEEIGLDQPIVAKLDTFENFAYTVTVGKAKGTNDENYNLRMTVQADLVKERTPGAEEKPEDKEKLDKDFKEKLQKLEDKLKQEKGFEKWTYVVSKWTIDPLLKQRKDFMAEKKAEEKKTDTSSSTSAKPHDHDHDLEPSPVATGLTPEPVLPPPLPKPEAKPNSE